jgi:hypothetical protein
MYQGIGKFLSVLAVASLANGCATIGDDLNHPGGIAGKQLDKRFFDAAGSRHNQLMRAVVITALASRVAVGTIRDGDDGGAFINRLEAVSRELNYLAGDMGGDTTRANCGGLDAGNKSCDTREALFESHLPQLEYKVARMVIAALPQKAAADFAQAAINGNVMASAWKFLKLAAASLDGAHRGAAAYRSVIEILAIGCTEDVDLCVGLSNRAGQEDKVINLRAAVSSLDDARFYAFYDLMRVSCMLLPITQDVNDNSLVTKRRDACKALTWKPAARFGGLTLTP